MARALAPATRLRVPSGAPRERARVLLVRYFGGWLGTLLLATAALSLYLVQVSSVATAGYDLQRLEAERNSWVARNEQLELELAKRRSLAWVEAQAVERLGMVRPDRAPPVIAVDAARLAATTSRGGARPPAPPSIDRTASVVPGDERARPSPGNPVAILDGLRVWVARLLQG